jgi:cell division septation protein DedD
MMERLVREQPNHKWAALARKEGLLDASANDDPMRTMLSEQGSAAELRFFESQFKTQAATSDGGGGVGMVVEDLSQVRFDNVDATVSAMERGVDVIFQAPLSMPLPLPVTAATAATQADATVATSASPRALEAGALGFRGVADFLVKVPLLGVKESGGRQVTTAGTGGEGGAMEVGNSGAEVGGSRGSGDGGGSSSGGLGVSWTYEVWDAKFAKRAEPSHVLQLWCYSEMVAAQVAQSLKKKQQLRTSQTTTTTTTPMPTVMSKIQGNGATAKTTVMSTHTTKAESAELSAESVLPHSRGCLVLNAATTINPIELAPYGAYYRDLKER